MTLFISAAQKRRVKLGHEQTCFLAFKIAKQLCCILLKNAGSFVCASVFCLQVFQSLSWWDWHWTLIENCCTSLTESEASLRKSRLMAYADEIYSTIKTKFLAPLLSTLTAGKPKSPLLYLQHYSNLAPGTLFVASNVLL